MSVSATVLLYADSVPECPLVLLYYCMLNSDTPRSEIYVVLPINYVADVVLPINYVADVVLPIHYVAPCRLLCRLCRAMSFIMSLHVAIMSLHVVFYVADVAYVVLPIQDVALPIRMSFYQLNICHAFRKLIL